MSIPDFQSIFLPLLKQLKDKKEHKLAEITENLAKEFNLSQEEREQLLPSGQQEVFNNRIGWARTYLKKAGCLDAPARATIVITDRGLDILSKNLNILNVKYLKQFPEFNDFHTMKNDKSNELIISEEDLGDQTPQETLELSYQKIRSALAQELLIKVKKSTPVFFERLVVELIVKMGYGGSIKDAGSAIGKSGDEGIDGIVKEDLLGLDTIYIQAKRYTDTIIGSPEIDKFIGALTKKRAKKGIFITTSSFSRPAIESLPPNDPKIVLIDGDYLTQLMIDYNIGVSFVMSYDVKKIDNDYFGDE